VVKYATHDEKTIMFNAWHDKLTSMPWGPVWTIVYVLGVLTASYHLSFGVWNFCIRWGITISERAQLRVQRFAVWMFVIVTLLGWGALLGFYIHQPQSMVV
jgi:succinate dehydrogenase / fumarate reductase cytochrome b subunit